MTMRSLSPSGRGAGASAAGGALIFTLGLMLGACSEATDDVEPDPTGATSQVTHNVLTPSEVADGWTLLFDGQSMDEWRGYGREDLPETWIVEEGQMTLRTSGGNMDGGDIVTRVAYVDFELTFDFKVGPSGNSGVFYRVREVDGKVLWQVAPEYQVLDDPAYPASEDWDPTAHRTGENYELHAAAERTVHPVGEWNSGRIVVDGNSVQHWLNREMTVEYELYTEDWEARVAAGKFATEEHYARASSGFIGLQDHGTPVWYRNMKIRPLNGG